MWKTYFITMPSTFLINRNMKKILFSLLLLTSMACQAQSTINIRSQVPSTVKPDSTMIVRISEIEVYPEYLKEYLEFAHNVGATSVRVEPGVICIYPMQQKRDECQIRILEIYASQEAYQQHIKTEHFQTYKQGTLHMVKHLDLVDMNQMAPEALPLIFRKAQGE